MHTSSNRTRDLALTATFAAFIAVLGLVPAFSPFGFPVPITLQSLGVMVVGAVLGPRRAAAAVLFFLLLVALGLPLLAGGRGGLGVFAGPSAGYLLGFPVAAAVIGALVYRRGAPYQLGHGLVATVIGGIIALYAIGVPVTAWRAGISLPAAMSGSALFLVGDLAKAVLAAVVAGAVHRADPRLLPSRAPVDTSAVPV
ncbi:BioY protein [Intrasporangium chromatireducens Q5-1]|uniref:Biotin transporter n=1 Tax=Intrasporangium chromatireducens Q5-1 TaxID=584657 RepID=W9GGV9_9MICO|nr:biotin transporter BioY [Intrasporangium chromatireducens]EWT04427.1 BioY protein [Intrasporangium chromatireducens Q5-1]